MHIPVCSRMFCSIDDDLSIYDLLATAPSEFSNKNAMATTSNATDIKGVNFMIIPKILI